MPPDPGAGADGVPARRDDHGQRRRAEGAWPSRRAPTTSSPSRSTRASSWPGSHRWRGSSGTRTRSSARRASSPPGTASSRRRVETQVAQLERMRRLRRFLSPQLAELIVDSGDESFLDSHRREIVVVFCDLRGFTPFAEASEPEEVMGVLKDYHEQLGDLIFRFEGTLERFTGDGLMVFFNDPVRCDDGPLRAIRMSVAMRTRIRGARRGLGAAGARPRARHRDRPGIRDARADRLRRALRLRGDRHRDEPRRPALLRSRARGRSLSRERVFSAAGPAVVGDDVGNRELRGFSRAVHAYEIKGVDSAQGVLMTGEVWTRAGRRRQRAVRRCPRTSGTAASTSSRQRMAGGLAGDAAQPRRRVRRRHPVDHPRPCRRQRAAA